MLDMYFHHQWQFGLALATITVTLHQQTRLILGWVTVCGQVHHLANYVTSHQINSAACHSCGVG